MFFWFYSDSRSSSRPSSARSRRSSLANSINMTSSSSRSSKVPEPAGLQVNYRRYIWYSHNDLVLESFTLSPWRILQKSISMTFCGGLGLWLKESPIQFWRGFGERGRSRTCVYSVLCIHKSPSSFNTQPDVEVLATHIKISQNENSNTTRLPHNWMTSISVFMTSW